MLIKIFIEHFLSAGHYAKLYAKLFVHFIILDPNDSPMR